MLIGIDGNEANIEKRVGIGQYAFQMLKHIYKVQSAKSKVQSTNIKFKIYLKDRPLSDLPKESSWWKYKIIKPKAFWTQIALPINLFLEKEKPNVFFSPSHYAPRFSPCSSVISIMDLSFVHFPSMFNKKDLWQLKNWTAYSVKNATKIFTISNYSKKDIVSYYGINSDKVVVTYPGYERTKFLAKPDLAPRDKSNKYILFVGTLQPRKNIARLVEAFKIATTKFSDETMKLIIAGKKGWLYEEVFQKVKELSIEKRVIFTGYVKEEDLPGLYGSAKCLVLPSLYEGFGIPVLEAMACGCPVVVSNVSSLPEIVGEAGILVDPLRTISIAQGIEQVCYDNLRRNMLISKGLNQVKKFSWERCARITLEVLEKL